jgi:hypothetical protein
MDAEPAQTRDVARSGGGPAEQFAGLLARAENGGRLELELAEVRSALMHHCALHSCRHAKGPTRRLNRRTYQHSFLLPDGGVRVLWELEHDTDPDGVVRSVVFAGREDLAVAEWEADTAFGTSAGPVELPAAASGRPDPGASGGRGGGGVSEPPAGDRSGELPGLGIAGGDRSGRAAFRRTYTEGDSAEHAWRLLRRAANTGAPGDDVRDRLRAAVAHGISIVSRRSTVVAGRVVCWSLYEHAFLLPDGSELSLWEIDHTRTPGGHPVCEVYGSRDAALDTAVRRIEAG